MKKSSQMNIHGRPLELCSQDPLTGFFRNGCCDTDNHDRGLHTVCVILTDEFLKFSLEVGNDLSTPRPEFDFPGLKPGQNGACVQIDGLKLMKVELHHQL